MECTCQIDILKDKKLNLSKESDRKIAEEKAHKSIHLWYDSVDKYLYKFNCSRLEYEYVEFETKEYGPLEVFVPSIGWVSGKYIAKPVININKQDLIINNVQQIEDWYNNNEVEFDISYVEHDNKTFTFKLNNINKISQINDSLYAERFRFSFYIDGKIVENIRMKKGLNVKS